MKQMRIRTAIRAGMDNPASTNCTNLGGQWSALNVANCGEIGLCAFPEGKICEEWALMRGECQPPKLILAR